MTATGTGTPSLPPSPGEIARRLAPLCRAYGITRLELYGSVARGEARPGSDVDLVVTLAKPLGWDYFTLDARLGEALGVLAGINFAGMLFTTLIPETKGKSLEELNGEDVLPLTYAAGGSVTQGDVPAPAPATQALGPVTQV